MDQGPHRVLVAGPRDEQLDLGSPVARIRVSHSNDRGPVGQLANLQYIGKAADKHAKKARRALESQAMGNHYTVTSKMELVPQEQGTVATALETERAARLAREDWKIRSAASRPHATTSGGGWEQKGGKGKESKGKGKGKEGKKSDGGQGAWQKSTWHQEVSKEEEKKDPRKK